MNQPTIIKRVHFSTDEKMYERMKAIGMFKNLDFIMATIVNEYLEEKGY